MLHLFVRSTLVLWLPTLMSSSAFGQASGGATDPVVTRLVSEAREALDRAQADER
jgi:hypothetical protein